MNKKERLDLAKWTISYAQKSGADQVAVSLSNKREIEIEFRDKKIEKLKESTQNSIDLRIYAKQRYSGHSTNDLKKASLERFIDEAVASTSYLTKDEYRSLPDPKYYPGKSEMNLEICDQDYGKIESSDRVKMAAEIEKVAMSQSDQIISSTSWYSDVSSQTIKIHSNGFQGESEGTYFQAGAEVTVKDEQRGRPEDYAYAVTRFNKDLPSPEMLGKEAAKRALSKIGQKKIESGQYDMIVENRSVGRLLSMLTQPMSGSALQQKRSFLDGMIGKKIASEKFTIIDDPFLKKGIGSRFFDGDGLATKKRVVIDKGVLRYYFIDDYYGKKLGMEPTTGSPSNILFEDGSESLK
jgi:PmbA protein